jgi:hypothetical protein
VSATSYRELPPREPDPYLVAWATRSRRLRFMWVTLLATPFAAMLGLMAFVALLGPSTKIGRVAAVVIWISGMTRAVFLGHFNFPRCGKWWLHRANGWDQCSSCGIKIGTPRGSP